MCIQEVSGMSEHRKKLSVTDLVVGMYVSDLDRPWCETPFPLQGFCVRSDADVREISRYCKDVYIDLDRDNSNHAYTAHEVRAVVNAKNRRGSPKGFKVKAIRIKHEAYPVTRSFKQEVKNAKKLQAKVNSAVENLMTSISAGSFDSIEETKDVASQMVDSVVQNPDALLWVSRVKESGEYWYSRSIHSAIWAIVMGRHIGLSMKDLEALAIGVLLCKAGKAELPQNVLSLVDESEKESLELSQQFVLYSSAIVGRISDLPEKVKSVVNNHCERHDGSGYPHGITGDRIPVLAKIAGLVDAYEALINAENDGALKSTTEAIAELHSLKNVLFQEDIVEEFIQSIGVYPTGTIVELSDNKVGAVVGNNSTRRLKPRILLLLDKDRSVYKKRKIIDLFEEEEKGVMPNLNIMSTLPRGYHGIDLTDPAILSSTTGWSLFSFG